MAKMGRKEHNKCRPTFTFMLKLKVSAWTKPQLVLPQLKPMLSIKLNYDAEGN
jgi:hypothetical protein